MWIALPRTKDELRVSRCSVFCCACCLKRHSQHQGMHADCCASGAQKISWCVQRTGRYSWAGAARYVLQVMRFREKQNSKALDKSSQKLECELFLKQTRVVPPSRSSFREQYSFWEESSHCSKDRLIPNSAISTANRGRWCCGVSGPYVLCLLNWFFCLFL